LGPYVLSEPKEAFYGVLTVNTPNPQPCPQRTLKKNLTQHTHLSTLSVCTPTSRLSRTIFRLSLSSLGKISKYYMSLLFLSDFAFEALSHYYQWQRHINCSWETNFTLSRT